MERRKRILVAGGSHSEMPVIEAAKNQGYYVITTGNDSDAIGHRIADKYVAGDYSDKEFIYYLAESEHVEGIVSGANDFSYISVSYACEKLGLKGHDTFENARKIHIKDEFRKLQQELGIKSPTVRKYYGTELTEDIGRDVTFPVVVKPVDLTGGKGVEVCNNLEKLHIAITKAKEVTREDYVIIEDYIEGTPHGFSSIIKDGRVVWHMIDNEQYGENKYLVLGAFSPSDVPQHVEYTLINDIEKIAEKCGLVDGLFHVQFILDKTGYPVMIDPCRRMPGDLYVLLAKYTTGVDIPHEIIKHETYCTDETRYVYKHRFVARECIMGDKSGIIKDVFVDQTVKEKMVYSYYRDFKGEALDDPLKYKAGIIIMSFDSYSEMIKMVKNFRKLVHIEME